MAIDTISAQCFIAVADTGSFTKAASRVGRTQSAVSQQIAKLENFVGKQLFVRGKIFSLTNKGEIFLGYIRQIFALHREAIDCFKEPELKGEVRFGVPEDFASVFLYDVLREFSQIHPKILLNIECDLTLNLYEKFKHKEFDLVVEKCRGPGDALACSCFDRFRCLSWYGGPEELRLGYLGIDVVESDVEGF
jgi:DNA-binding transcriptional LysR family regulator